MKQCMSKKKLFSDIELISVGKSDRRSDPNEDDSYLTNQQRIMNCLTKQ